LAHAQATEQAWILGGRMAQRTERLLSVTDASVKGAAELDQRLFDDDPLSASRRRKMMSRWASRRLFERLIPLDAPRELRAATR
jgi:hypothetical protein